MSKRKEKKSAALNVCKKLRGGVAKTMANALTIQEDVEALEEHIRKVETENNNLLFALSFAREAIRRFLTEPKAEIFDARIEKMMEGKA